jgi:hypothetical protein
MVLVSGASHRTLLGVTNPLVPIPESVKEGTVSRVSDVLELVPYCTTDVKSIVFEHHIVVIVLVRSPKQGALVRRRISKKRQGHPRGFSPMRLQISRTI